MLAACRERGVEELLDPESNDLDEWEVLVACLAGAVLWDEDWKDVDQHLDADRTATGVMKKLLGIDRDYYVTVPPDPDRRGDEGGLGHVAGADADPGGKAVVLHAPPALLAALPTASALGPDRN